MKTQFISRAYHNYAPAHRSQCTDQPARASPGHLRTDCGFYTSQPLSLRSLTCNERWKLRGGQEARGRYKTAVTYRAEAAIISQ